MSDHRPRPSRDQASAPSETLCFGPFAFEVGPCRLTRDGIEVHLTPKAAAVLCHLLQHPGELISKDEFLEVVWEGVHVREESLTQAISVIRQMLGDSAQSPRYIQTISGEGYRFVGEVREEQASSEAPVVLETGVGSAAESSGKQHRLVVPGSEREATSRKALQRSVARRGLVAAAVIVAVVAASVYLLAPPADPDLPTIVVLPATVIGQTEEQQLFAAGIGDELATKLALVIPGVVPYSVAMSYDRTGKTWAEIAEYFEADYILEVSVRFGDTETNAFRVNSKLFLAPDGRLLWDFAYDGSLDSLRFLEQQAEVAVALLEWLGRYHYQRSTESIRDEPVDDRHDLYALAIEHLREAQRGLPYDPDVDFILAGILRRQGDWNAHVALLERAIRRQPEEKKFLITLATSYIVMKEHERAEELLTRYSELSPTGNGPYQVRTYNYLAWSGPLERAHEFLVRTPAVTPPPCGFYLSWILVHAAERKFEDIIRLRETASRCTNTWIGNMAQSFDLYAALAYRRLGMDENASRALEVAAEYYESELKRRPRVHGMHATLGLIYALQGRREEALERARHAMDLWPMEQDAFQGSEPVQFYIRTLAQLGEPGDLDRALDRLDELLAMPASVTIAYVRNDPFMDPIVKHPRFQELVEKYAPPGDRGDEAMEP